MSNNDMNLRVERYFELLAEIEALNTEVEEIKDSLKNHMAENGTEEIMGDGWKATWHNTKNNRFNTAKFKKDLPEVYSAYLVSSTGTRFTLNQITATA